MDDTGREPPSIEVSGIGRRSLIKRAAAAGAVAWTAPVVIGSLASPAGAITGQCVLVQWDLNSNCTYQKNTNANDCLPTPPPGCGTAFAVTTPDTIFGVPNCSMGISCPTATSLVLTIPGCAPDAYFLSGASKGTGTGGCVQGSVSNAGKTLTFTWATSSAARVAFYIIV